MKRYDTIVWPLTNGDEIVFWRLEAEAGGGWAADHHSSSHGSIGYIASGEPLHRAEELAQAWLVNAGRQIGPSDWDDRPHGHLRLAAETLTVPPVERDLFGNVIPRRRTLRDDDEF